MTDPDQERSTLQSSGETRNAEQTLTGMLSVLQQTVTVLAKANGRV
jgi:hypothetical protein